MNLLSCSPAHRPRRSTFPCAVLALACTALWPAWTDADTLRPLSVHIVGSTGDGQRWTDRPTEARLQDNPELTVVLIARERSSRSRRRRRVYLVDDSIGELRVKGRRVRDRERRPWSALSQVEGVSGLEDVAVRWSRVEPHAWRQPGSVSRNGATSAHHTNVSQDPGSYGKWLGYDEIEYFETPLGPFSNAPSARRIPATARPTRPDEDLYGGLGTMRYKVEVRLGAERILTTPGKGALDRYGIRTSVHRVSVRSDDSFLGYLSSYYLVPEVFGSAGSGKNHQTERYTGADCADVLTGAVRRAGYKNVWHTSVAGLGRYTTQVVKPFLIDDTGGTEQPVTGVQPGDLIRLDYGGSMADAAPRPWDHIVVLYQDKSDPQGPHKGAADGALDGFDLVVHMGHPRLVIEPLSSQGQAKLDVLRWNKRKMKNAPRP